MVDGRDSSRAAGLHAHDHVGDAAAVEPSIFDGPVGEAEDRLGNCELTRGGAEVQGALPLQPVRLLGLGPGAVDRRDEAKKLVVGAKRTGRVDVAQRDRPRIHRISVLLGGDSSGRRAV